MSAVPPNHETLRRSVRTRRERKERWQREGERSLAQTLGMIGALGWLVVVPTLARILVGAGWHGVHSRGAWDAQEEPMLLSFGVPEQGRLVLRP